MARSTQQTARTRTVGTIVAQPQSGGANWYGNLARNWQGCLQAIHAAPVPRQVQTDALGILSQAMGKASAMITGAEFSTVGPIAATPAGNIPANAAQRQRTRTTGTRNAGQSENAAAAYTDFQRRCITALSESEGLTAAQLAEKIGSKAMTVGRALGPLVKQRAGPVTRKGDLFYLRSAEVTPLRKTA